MGDTRPFLAAALAAGSLALATPLPGQVVKVSVIDTAIMTAPRLTESSGVIPSSRPGVFWTHNDSGDGPFLYATDTLGHDLGFVRVAPARNRDWEDISAGPCFVADGRCLYIGDIGDNHARRHHIVIYRVRDPAPPAGPGDTTRTVPLLDSIVLRYPDHPHDAEGLAVTDDGRVLIATKDRFGPAVVFETSATAPSPVLSRRCTLALTTQVLLWRVVTGLALRPDGRVLVARTYVSLHAFRPDSVCTPLTPPQGITIPVIEAQGEGVTFDGMSHLVLTSERGDIDHSLMTRLRIDGLPPR